MKHIHRFFVSQSLKTGDCACLDEEDSFHAGKVLRLGAGDTIELADSSGRVFSAQIIHTYGGVEARADELVSAPDAGDGSLRLTVVQALPSGKKMDLIVEKLSELGVRSLFPVYSELSVARKPRDGKGDTKLERWRRIARSAASQSKRSDIMDVSEPAPLRQWLRSNEHSDGLLALVTEQEGTPLGDAVAGMSGGVHETALVIGPESGFSASELELLEDAGAGFVTLGSQVLRTETAALIAAAIVMHRLGALG